MKAKVKKLIWFGVSTGIIVLMVYFADFARVADALKRIDVIKAAPAFFSGISVFFIWSYVWHSFFNKMGIVVPYTKSFKLFMSGNFLNSVTPLGQLGGEPLMAYIIKKNTDASIERAFSTVFSADIVNTVPVFTFILGGAFYSVFFTSGVESLIFQIMIMAGVVGTLGALLVYLLWFRAGFIESRIVSLAKKISSVTGRGNMIVSKIKTSMERLQNSFETIGESPEHLAKILVIAHLGFVAQVFSLYFLLLAIGANPRFTPLYFILALSALANFTPTPGGSGTYEAAMAGFLTLLLDLDFASAISIGILFRMTTYWPGLLIGYISLNSLERGVE